ncbi:hypothetical protein BON30_47410 [Cystobacter ferrugineus]|uniref:Major facilitator superfamily (MFS) profile domain-containing protein n=2 Tax=Cystobacter ferrugineus TaxID=83449 RepID=A0A1L9AUH9_9BACT|nr:hypothetical protein BON30_47410 [Cystobacter ferrugineus]
MSVATQMQSVAIAWFIYERTGRPLDLGLVGLAQFLPQFVLSLPAGHMADRFDRRRIMQVCNAASVVCSLLFLAITRSEVRALWPLYAVVMLLSAARAFSGPASQALLPSLVPTLHPQRAVGWNSLGSQAATIAGPALGGVLYSVSGSAVAVFTVGALLGMLSLALLWPIRPTLQVVGGRGAASWTELLAGLRFVWREKRILGCISLDLFAVLLGGAEALLPIFARDILHVGPWGLGLLRSAPAIGASLVGAALVSRPLRRAGGSTLLATVALFGAATLTFGLSRSVLLSLLALLVLGAADMVSMILRGTLLQFSTPAPLRGRVNAVNQLFVGTSNELGAMESGLMAAWLGIVPAVVLGGVGTCAIVLLWAVLFPELRKPRPQAESVTVVPGASWRRPRASAANLRES